MGNRKAFTTYVINEMARIIPGNKSAEFVEAKLKSLSDKEFDDLVGRVEREEFFLPIYINNSDKERIDLTKLVKISQDLGFEPFEQLVVEDPKTGQVYQTEVKYWIALFPCRRQVQYLLAKTSNAKDNKTRDVMTGQVAGSSKSSSFSAPQMAGMLGRGCKDNALELAKFRGGDISAGRALQQQLINSGGASLEPILKNNSSPTVKNTLASYLNACHLQHSL